MERDLFLSVVEDLTVPDVSAVPRPFVLLVALDVADVDPADAAHFADGFLAVEGCICVHTWGNGCEWLHDVFDDAFARAVPEDQWEDKDVITTWESDTRLDEARLDEALWYSIYAAYNDPGIKSVVAVTSKEHAEQIERRFSHVEQLNRDVVGE